MSRGVDWKQAMLNEAEAAGDEVWAQETRRVAALNLWAVQWWQVPLYLFSMFMAAFLRAAIADLSMALPAEGCWEAGFCWPGFLLASGLLVLLYALLGWLFQRWNIAVFFMVLFAVTAPQSVRELPVFEVLNALPGVLGFLTRAAVFTALTTFPMMGTYLSGQRRQPS